MTAQEKEFLLGSIADIQRDYNHLEMLDPDAPWSESEQDINKEAVLVQLKKMKAIIKAEEV